MASKSNQGGNFANDPEKASEAGKKGGQQSHQGSSGGSHQSHQGSGGSDESQQGSKSSGSQQGGSGNFANDRERASEAGKKGGEHSHRK